MLVFSGSGALVLGSLKGCTSRNQRIFNRDVSFFFFSALSAFLALWKIMCVWKTGDREEKQGAGGRCSHAVLITRNVSIHLHGRTWEFVNGCIFLFIFFTTNMSFLIRHLVNVLLNQKVALKWGSVILDSHLEQFFAWVGMKHSSV